MMSIVSPSSCPTCGNSLKVVKYVDALGFCEDIQYDCLICGYRYSYVTETQEEKLTSTYCSTCDKNFNQSSSLKRHMTAHSSERPFCCKECDKSFKTKAALKRHEIIHTGECPYECSTCKRRFNQISNLRKHLVIHDNKCPFYCKVCGKGFNQLSNLKKHLVVHREVSEQKVSIPSSSKKPDVRPILTFVKPAEN